MNDLVILTFVVILGDEFEDCKWCDVNENVSHNRMDAGKPIETTVCHARNSKK